MNSPLDRRTFLQEAVAVGLGLAAVAQGNSQADTPKPATPRIKLGLDNFALRAMGWKAERLIEYSGSLKLDSLLISNLDAFESFEPEYLRRVKDAAARQNLELHVGTWSICPTSTTFKNTWGTAEEHLALGIRVAQAVGSPVIRVVLGNGKDRLTDGGIEARIEDTVKVCKSQRGRAMDAGVKIAVENHAGDMQAWELVQLIEAAGRDYVGANVDSGNAVWSMEDPLVNLNLLGPYALTTSLRDSAAWESKDGATIQWTAMGEGNVDLAAYFRRFAELCPQVPVHIETISGFNRELPYFQPDFWKAWPRARASDFAKFLKLVKQGTPRAPRGAAPGPDRQKAEQAFQQAEFERSIEFCRKKLGLGLHAR